MSEPLITWERLRAGNQRTIAMASAGNESPAARPTVAVFRCADAVPAPETVFGQRGGSLFNISTWGHVIDTGVLASIEYAVEVLDVNLIVILGHDDCPAMRAALRAWEYAEMPGGATRCAVEHAMLSIVRRDTTADSVAAVAAAHIVETGLALMQRSPTVARKVDERECGIVCATESPVDGRVVAHATFGFIGDATETLVECV